MKKRKIAIIISLIIALILLAIMIGMLLTSKNNSSLPDSDDITYENQVSPTAEPTTEPTEVPTPTVDIKDIKDETVDDQWKQAYIDYIKNTLVADPWAGYALINVDNDSIPELVAIGSSEAQGNQVLNYSDGNVYSTQLARLGFFYIEKENLLNNSGGHMDYYYDIIYSLIVGKLTQIAIGNWGALDGSELKADEDGKLIYQYIWDDVSVAEEDYKQSLNTIFDKEKAIDGHTIQHYSFDEIINMIENYSNQ